MRRLVICAVYKYILKIKILKTQGLHFGVILLVSVRPFWCVRGISFAHSQDSEELTSDTKAKYANLAAELKSRIPEDEFEVS